MEVTALSRISVPNTMLLSSGYYCSAQSQFQHSRTELTTLSVYPAPNRSLGIVLEAPGRILKSILKEDNLRGYKLMT